MTITYGVRERTRTADLRGHNPALCQLSYTQHLLVQMEGFEPTLKPICILPLHFERTVTAIGFIFTKTR